MNYTKKLFIDFWKKTFNYKTIISRKDYWITILINTIILIVLLGLLYLALPTLENINENTPLSTGFGTFIVIITLLLSIYYFVSIFPLLSMTARRLRDTGCTPWVLLLTLLPGGAIFIFVLTLFPTKENSAYNPEYARLYNNQKEEE